MGVQLPLPFDAFVTRVVDEMANVAPPGSPPVVRLAHRVEYGSLPGPSLAGVYPVRRTKKL